MADDVREALRAYFSAAVLMEPIQFELWQDASLTLIQLRILYVLREAPRAAAELARAVGIDPTSLTRVLDRMEERGLLQRDVDPRDRRRLVITASPQGLGLLGEHPVLRGTKIDIAMRLMSQAESEAVQRAFDLLVERVQATSLRESGGMEYVDGDGRVRWAISAGDGAAARRRRRRGASRPAPVGGAQSSAPKKSRQGGSGGNS